MTVFLVVWILAKLPDFSGLIAGKRASLRTVSTLSGVPPVLFMTLNFVMAHNILYTYIAPFLHAGGMGERVDIVLLAFGIASLIGIWGAGTLVDRRLRELVLVSFLLFAVAALGFGI